MTPITIAIIGADTEKGKSLSSSLSRDGFRLLLCGERTEAVSQTAGELKKASPHQCIEHVSCSLDAGWEADVVFLAEETGNLKDLVEHFKRVVTRKPVFTTTAQVDELRSMLQDSCVSSFEEGNVSELVLHAITHS